MPPALSLRDGAPGDADLLRAWRNDPATRAASRNTAEIGESEHAAWLERVLADPDRHLLVAEREGTPVGSVRFDPRGDGDLEISVVVAPEARGSQVGTGLIADGVAWVAARAPGATIVAEVRPENRASRVAFRKLGFHSDGGPASEGFERLVLVTDSPARGG